MPRLYVFDNNEIVVTLVSELSTRYVIIATIDVSVGILNKKKVYCWIYSLHDECYYSSHLLAQIRQ